MCMPLPLDGLQPATRHRGHGVARRHEQIAERLARRTPHAAAKLVQLAKSETVRIVDKDGVDVGHVHAVLDDGGGQKQIVVTVGEVYDGLLHLLGRHLAVGYHHAHARHQTL